LNPEQRVRFLYFQLLEHGEKAEVGRLPAETPARYAPRLESTIDATNEDVQAIDELTEAFIDVRYAGRQVESQYTEHLRVLWTKLRSKLVSKDAEDQTS
jgi:hypothetical protein